MERDRQTEKASKGNSETGREVNVGGNGTKVTDKRDEDLRSEMTYLHLPEN